jgi:2-methylisocitrate lyase-like PEP mutase family enzyme
MDAKQALDPDFVIMARCDLGGVPGASFAEIVERCQAYKAEAQVDVICPNGLRTWEEIQEAIRLIPGPVVPLIPPNLSPYPSLQARQDAGAAAAWFPALTTMAGLQANWDFLSDFQKRGTLALDALRAQAAESPWGVASWPHSGRVASALHGGDVSSKLKLGDTVAGSRRVRGKRTPPTARDALPRRLLVR